jgi:gliding motility-associated-like protein
MQILTRLIMFFFFSLFVKNATFAQNENNKWYFGFTAGLDFMTNPPTILTNGLISTSEGCASVANSAGNLLFYTDGSTIRDQTHAVMANGTGLTGNSSTTQSALIVKRPGSNNIYYVFSLGASGNASLCVSTIDMTLAGGNGSVTVKNTLVSTGMSEKLTSVKHCNGTDFWVLAHTGSGNTFRAFLVSSLGVNLTPVTSVIGSSFTGAAWAGCMKVSNNGTKIGMALYSMSCFEIFDFNASTGVVSNSLNINVGTGVTYGCEFSPDGTVFYGSKESGSNNLALYQWNLCAGSNTAIIASQFTLAVTSQIMAMQLATNGKIYVARNGSTSLGVINNPNILGAGCSYTHSGQSISPRNSSFGLPNFITSGFKPPPPPFTFTVSNSFGCQTAAFTSPTLITTFTNNLCSASGYSLTGLQWQFGNPASGAANTSTLNNPTHAFTTLGTYTVGLILYYSCGGGTDTIKQIVNINQPCISVSSTSITCANLGSATVAATGGIGPYSYTWMPGNQTNSVATGLSPGTYTITVYDFGNNFTYTATTTFNSLIPLTGNLNFSSSVTCHGASTGTANYTNIQGGSPNQNYYWSNGAFTYTSSNANISTLSAGIWTSIVTDALTGCTIYNLIPIMQPPALTLNLAATSNTQCVNFSLSINSSISGGTAPYNFLWLGSGATTSNNTVSQNASGNFIYTLNCTDSYSCPVSETISLQFIANPSLTLTNIFICPLETGTLNVTGANSYTWQNSSISSSFTDNPTANQEYTVIGAALGCTSIATASIIIKPLPFPVLVSNSGICNGKNLIFSANGGTNFVWTGPQGYSSSIQSNTIVNANPSNSGAYNVTVTAANSCTAVASANFTIHPTPNISAIGATVCNNQSFNLTANSNLGGTYFWNGPLSFSSNNQNPFFQNAQVNASGNYTVITTSPQSCTNTAVANLTVTALPNIVLSSNSPLCFGSNLILNGNNSTGASNYSWAGPNGFSSAMQNPIISNVLLGASGIYTLTITIGPCIRSAQTSVIVNALPTPTASNNGPICEKSKIILSAITPSNNIITNYVWQGPNNFSALFSLTQIDTAKLIHAGIYTVLVIDNNGCQNMSTTTLSVLNNPTIIAVGVTVCLNEIAILNANGGNSYTWYNSNAILGNSSQLIINKSSNLAPSVYTVIGTSLNTCTASATATLFTLPLPILNIDVSPKDQICLNSNFVLTGNGALNYNWRGPGNTLYTGKIIRISANNLSFSGIYTLTASDINACQSTITTSIVVNNLPKVNLSKGILEACVPFTSEYIFVPSSSTNSLSSFSWELDGKTYTNNAITKTFSKAGTYPIKCKLKDINDCSNTMSLIVNAWPQPIANFSFTPNNPIENLNVVEFINTSNSNDINEWNWYFMPDLNSKNGYNSRDENTSYLFSNAGKYPVALVIKNEKGCSDSIVKVISVQEDFNVFVPNAFTPNQDKKNENFMAVTRGVTDYHLSIFNRWNELLFETKDPNIGWDGTFKGNMCKQDVYLWQLKVTSANGTKYNYQGKVLLIQ